MTNAPVPKYSCSHVQQGRDEPESLSRFRISAMIFVLSFQAKAIYFQAFLRKWHCPSVPVMDELG
jgi:hypothetical protein